MIYRSNYPQDLFFPAMAGILLWKEIPKRKIKKHENKLLLKYYTMVTIVPATCQFFTLGEKIMD